MKVTVSLFGAFRDHEPAARLEFELPATADVAALRRELEAHAATHWPHCRPELLRHSAFASATRVLREGDRLPEDGAVAVLPPVSGG